VILTDITYVRREEFGMQFGIVLAIKTLADRFEPLPEVYKGFIGDALVAEDAGFDFVSTSEHHFEADAWSPSQLPVLAYLAAHTSRVRLHTNVFLLPLHDPLRVSEDTATVDILSNGRLDLICGSGSVAEEFRRGASTPGPGVAGFLRGWTSSGGRSARTSSTT
jgi:hypothetical protein